MHRFLKILLIAELLLLPLIAISSWICSVYQPAIRSLLAPNGLRWIFTSIISNFTSLPIAEIILILIAISLLSFLNLSSLFHHRPTPKEKRALFFALLMLVMNIFAIAALTFLPPYILLNFFGSLLSSPLTDSIPGLLFVAIETTGCTYAYTSGRMTTIQDFSVAHSSFINLLSPLFIHLFLIAQIIGWMGYSNILSVL